MQFKLCWFLLRNLSAWIKGPSQNVLVVYRFIYLIILCCTIIKNKENDKRPRSDIHARLWVSIFNFMRCNCWRSLSISILLLFRLSLNDTWSLSATLWSLGSSSSSIDSSTACSFILRDLFSFSRLSIFLRHFWNSSELLTCVGNLKYKINTLFCIELKNNWRKKAARKRSYK